MQKSKKIAARPKTKRRSALNPKQQCFVREYLIDKNAAAAYVRAGYSKKTAETCGPRLLRNAQVRDAVQKALDAQANRVEITKDEWLRELWIVGKSDLANHLEIEPETGAIRARAFEDMPGESRRALESITEIRTIHESANGDSVVNSRVTFRLHPKIKALEDIGDHFGWLKQNGKVEIPGVEKALYVLSEKFLPAVGKNPDRGHDPK